MSIKYIISAKGRTNRNPHPLMEHKTLGKKGLVSPIPYPQQMLH